MGSGYLSVDLYKVCVMHPNIFFFLVRLHDCVQLSICFLFFPVGGSANRTVEFFSIRSWCHYCHAQLPGCTNMIF